MLIILFLSIGYFGLFILYHTSVWWYKRMRRKRNDIKFISSEIISVKEIKENNNVIQFKQRENKKKI
jgi:hypothetical protein